MTVVCRRRKGGSLGPPQEENTKEGEFN